MNKRFESQNSLIFNQKIDIYYPHIHTHAHL